MARKTTKRKSESALPTGKSKRRKTATHRGDDSDSASADDDDSSDNSFVKQKPVAAKYVKKNPVKSRKSEPIMRASRGDEYEEDEGRIESKQFLALVEFESKKKKRAAKAASEYMEKLEDNINCSEDSLKRHLTCLNIETNKQETNFMEVFEDAYAASRPLPTPRNVASQGKLLPKDVSFATLYDRSQEVIAAAKLIIHKFENANERTSKVDMAGMLKNNWGAENDSIATLLEIGHRIGLEKFEAMLIGSDAPEVEKEDAAFVNRLYQPTEGHNSIPWGRIATKQEKSARKLVKAIAMEVM